jgi:hypothetical protein
MARQTVAAQNLSHGLAPTKSAILAADDAQFLWESTAFLLLENTTGGTLVATIATNQAIDGLTVPNLTVSIPANSIKYTKSFPRDTYNQADGYVYVNTAADGISMAVLRPA